LSEAPRDQVAAIVELLRRVLGGTLLGAYLYGSAVDGGLRPDSDLDLFGVTSRRLEAGTRRAIVHGLLPLSDREQRPTTWRPVELTLVVRHEVRPWRYPPRVDLQYGEWLRPAFLAGNLEPWPPTNPDLAMLVTMVRARAEPLLGPPAGELLDVVPRQDLLLAIGDELPALIDDLPTDTRNVLLTLARMWMTAASGELRPKHVAADWALARMPADERPILARARAGYLGIVKDRWDDLAAVTAVARRLVGRIEGEIGALPPGEPSV
jgi:predicted nucleotidyltransferase